MSQDSFEKDYGYIDGKGVKIRGICPMIEGWRD